MDFDRHADIDEMGGSDGCLVFSEPDNVGLENTWISSDSTADKPFFQTLYDDIYGPLGMSRGDYWVALGNAVVKAASPNQALNLPFRWGRLSVEDCSFSQGRQPGATGCGDIEHVFIDRLGLSWRDATALMGGHTLGTSTITSLFTDRCFEFHLIYIFSLSRWRSS